jgi:hypothetical protein
MTAILEDIVAEGRRLLEQAARDEVPLRLLGGVAIRLRAPGGELPAPFRRDYQDLDFITAKGGSGATDRLLRSAGYEPHVAFNALHQRERMLFFDTANDRQVDVFVGSFRMCHEIPLDGRIAVDPGTLPLADLLLTKLQVVELNEKDVRDALALLHGHPLADDDGAVNGARIAELLSRDWGLWRTITANLQACAGRIGDYDLPGEERDELARRMDALLRRIEDEPKTRGWRLRAKIGERKRWYELPEEVAQ